MRVANASFVDGMVAQVERADSEISAPMDSNIVDKVQLSETRKIARVREFGLEADPTVLRDVRAVKKNTSPFNPTRFLPMLKPCPQHKQGKMTLVLDIDETLVHASVKPRVDVVYDTVLRFRSTEATGEIAVAFRPGLLQFLRAVAGMFEVVVFTASQQLYANQLMNILDPTGDLVTDRLFREHCTEVNGARVKDLSLLGRPLERMIIIDNSPVAYLFQPRNAIPIISWFDDPQDDELMKLLPVLQQISSSASVYPVLDMYNAGLQTSAKGL